MHLGAVMATLAPTARLSLQRVLDWDRETLVRVARTRTAVWTVFMRVVTLPPVWVTLLLLGVAQGDHGEFWPAALAGGVVAGMSSLLVQPLKFAVRRRRPVLHAIVTTLDRYSFPSGHSTTAFALAVGALFAAPAFFPVALGLAAVVAFSRVYLGVHYLSDVVGGAVVGVLVGVLLFTSELPAWAAGLLTS